MYQPERPLACPANAAVHFHDVWFSYEAGRGPALKGASFEVEAGRTVALVGRSGAGKSTCANLLAGLRDPDAGAITIGGIDVRDVPNSTLRRLVAVVPQSARLSDDSVAENIRLGRPDATQVDIERAARAAQAHDFIMQLPLGYRTLCGEQGSRFSSGERQRIAIARALLCDAPVLVLDEAASDLDTETERALQTALAKFGGGRTVLIIAHRLSTIRNADWIVVLENGRVVEEGEHDRLVLWGDRYARLVAAQRGSEPERAHLALHMRQ